MSGRKLGRAGMLPAPESVCAFQFHSRHGDFSLYSNSRSSTGEDPAPVPARIVTFDEEENLVEVQPEPDLQPSTKIRKQWKENFEGTGRYLLFLFPVLVALMVWGAVVRWRFSGRYGFWSEEISLYQNLLAFSGFWDYIRRGLFSHHIPSLYDMLGLIGVHLAGAKELGFRLPAILFSVLAPIPISILVYRMSGRIAGLAAAVLAISAPVAIRFGCDAAPHSLSILMIATAWLAWRELTAARLTPVRVFILGLATCAALASSYLAIIPLAIIAIVSLVNRRHWQFLKGAGDSIPYYRDRRLLLVGAVFITLCTLLWIVKVRSVQEVLGAPSSPLDLSLAHIWAYWGSLWQTNRVAPDFFGIVDINPVPIALLILTVAALASPWWNRVGDRITVAAILAVSVFAVPVIAWRLGDYVAANHALCAFPAIVAVLSAGVAAAFRFFRFSFRTPEPWRPLWVASGALGLCALVLCGATLYEDAAKYHKEPYFREWREKAGYIESLAARRKPLVVIVSSNATAQDIGFYEHIQTPRLLPDEMDNRPSDNTWICMVNSTFDKIPASARDLWTKGRQKIVVRGTIPAIELYPPASAAPDNQSAEKIQIEESLYMQRYVLPDHQSWVYADIAAAARKTGNAPLATMANQLLFQSATDDMDRAGAMNALGLTSKATWYYRTYLDKTPVWRQKGYMWANYARVLKKQAAEESGIAQSHLLKEARKALVKAVGMSKGSDAAWIQEEYQKFQQAHPDL